MRSNDDRRVISVNVGLPREVNWPRRKVLTGIYKYPVAGPLMVRTLNMDGDGQGDLKNHGGAEQAVYAYPAEHYAYWREQLPGVELPWGVFGENLTIVGLSETEVMIGDQFRIGSTELVVTRPRSPCFKLANRLAQKDMIKRFLNSGRTGFYLAVLQEGKVMAGDHIIPTKRCADSMSVRAITELVRDPSDSEGMRRAVALEALAPRLRTSFKRKLARRAKVG